MLIKCNLPACIIRFLINFYMRNFVRISWCGVMSDYFCAINVPLTRRPRAHHIVNPYLGARRQNETKMCAGFLHGMRKSVRKI